MEIPRYSLAGALIAIAIPSFTFLVRQRQTRHLPDERVLVLGASSGLGRALALNYIRRGARVCAVARRADKLQELESEGCLLQVADMTVVDDMIRVRTAIETAWGGLDTMHVCAGVSALQPIMALTGGTDVEGDASTQEVSRAVETAGRAMKGNFEGPFIAAVTLVRTANVDNPDYRVQLLKTDRSLCSHAHHRHQQSSSSRQLRRSSPRPPVPCTPHPKLPRCCCIRHSLLSIALSPSALSCHQRLRVISAHRRLTQVQFVRRTRIRRD